MTKQRAYTISTRNVDTKSLAAQSNTLFSYIQTDMASKADAGHTHQFLEAQTTGGRLGIDGPTLTRIMTTPDSDFTAARTDAQNDFTGLQTINGGLHVGGVADPGDNNLIVDGTAQVTGAVTGATYNNVTITAPATGATLTIADTGSLITSGAYSITLVAATNCAPTLPAAGQIQGCALPNAPATTGNVNLGTIGAEVTGCLITPTNNCTFNSTGGVTGARFTIVILTSGVVSYTMTFNTGFRSQGTLATGVTSGKKFTVTFVFDGTDWCEVARTTAM